METNSPFWLLKSQCGGYAVTAIDPNGDHWLAFADGGFVGLLQVGQFFDAGPTPRTQTLMTSTSPRTSSEVQGRDQRPSSSRQVDAHD